MTYTNDTRCDDAVKTTHKERTDASSYPLPPFSQTQIKADLGHTKGAQFPKKETLPKTRPHALLSQRGQGLQEEALSESSASTVACDGSGLLPPDGVHLILPQAGKISWTVGPHYTNPKHSWVEPWPETDKIRHVIQPYFDSTAKLHIQPLGEGSWNRSWTVTVTSDGPVPWSSDGTHSEAACSSSDKVHQDGLSLGGINGSGLSGSNVHKFVMRIASPVYPWFKVEAEVATMEYIRRHCASIPVPRVFFYNSSSASQGNTLGYEWILMEYMPGVEFHEAAQDMTLPQKLRLAQKVADWEDQLSQLRFPAIGSIYFTKSFEDAVAVSASYGSGFLPCSWKVCEQDPDFCVGPAVMQEFLGDWRLSYPFSKGPFDNEGDLARSLVACRRLEASDPLQSLHSKLSAYVDLLKDLSDRSKKLRQHPTDQDRPPSPTANTMTRGLSDEMAQIQDDMKTAEAAIHRLRTCMADEAGSRGLPTAHVNMEGPPRFEISRGKQMSLSELQAPSLEHGESEIDKSVAASEAMGQAVNKLWPAKQTYPLFSHLSIASPKHLATLLDDDTEQSCFKTTGYTLHHWDISAHNVLVNPATGEPVALLDWEQLCTTSAITRGYNWYPILMSGGWAVANSTNYEELDQQQPEARRMRKAFLARLKTRNSPLLDGFIQICPHLGDRLQSGHESHDHGQVGGGQGEDDISDDNNECSCADSDSDGDSDDEDAQPSSRIDIPQGTEAARVKPAKQLNRARTAVAVSVLGEAYGDKYFRYNSQSLLRRARKYFG